MARPQLVSDAQIFATAREAFLEVGPGVPLSEIAGRLGISQAALLHRVGTKEALMLGALRPETPAAVQVLDQGPSESTPVEDQLLEALRIHLHFLKKLIPNLFVLRCANLSRERTAEGLPPPPVELREHLTAWLLRAQRRGLLEVEDPGAVSEALLGTLEARCFNAHVGGPTFAPGDDEALLRRLVRTFVLRDSAARRPSSPSRKKKLP